MVKGNKTRGLYVTRVKTGTRGQNEREDLEISAVGIRSVTDLAGTWEKFEAG